MPLVAAHEQNEAVSGGYQGEFVMPQAPTLHVERVTSVTQSPLKVIVPKQPARVIVLREHARSCQEIQSIK